MIREDIFSCIDTKEKAYWLGFLYADGFITKRGHRFGMQLSQKDEIIVDRFIKFVGGDKNKKKYHLIKNKYKSVSFYVCNTKIVKDLAKYGCVYLKTNKITFPNNIYNGFKYAFLLGYYDGDGCQNSTTICGNENFLLSIKQEFNIPYDVKYKTNPYGSVHVLSLGIELYKRMISEYNNSLPRKRVIIYPKKKRKSKKIYKPRKLESDKINISNRDLQELMRTQSLIKVGLIFGVSENVIADHCKKNNIKVYDKHFLQMRFSPTKEELLNKMNELKWNFTAAGKFYNVTDNSVRKRCKKFDLIKPCKYYTRTVSSP